jgi:transglutaminase-like putative cysteine protease
VSRLEFRLPVALPRPRSATAMVALGSFTLAITGQIAAPVLALAALALGYVALAPEPASSWRRSAWLLNGGLAACVGVGFALWFRGELAIVALAHFAVLAQALQLLDARPRPSEFLLVALAVFQVTMAANLTDSAWYPLLLVAFTVCCVWTLVVHTLRAEALEAGELGAAQRILTVGLWRTTLVASLASVAFSALLFPILPRIRSGAIFDRSFVGGGASAGFSDRVELGDIGRIRQDSSIALRVETLEGEVSAPERRYWRGLAFDHFDGRRWSVSEQVPTPIYGDPEIGVDLGSPRRGAFKSARLVQRIAREEVSPGVIFSAGPATLLRGGTGRLVRDANGSLIAYGTSGKRVIYQVVTRPELPDLADDVAEPPGERGERYLQLPPLDSRIAQLAREITAGAPNDAARAARLAAWLQRHGRYTDTPPPLREGVTPVEQFLLERSEGHCEYFASAHVVLLRSLGIPARVVNGYAGGRENSLGGFIEVAQSDAHAWVEVHYTRAGWAPYDPTPADLRLAGADALRGGALSELASAVELWWFRNVVDFDRGHQARALRDLWMAWNRWRAEQRERGGAEPVLQADDGGARGEIPWRWLIGAAALAVAAWKLRLLRLAKADAALSRDYARALRWLRRRGLARAPATSAREFAREVAAHIPADGAEAFRALTEAYLAERFGGAPSARASHELARLRESLKRSA